MMYLGSRFMVPEGGEDELKEEEEEEREEGEWDEEEGAIYLSATAIIKEIFLTVQLSSS